MARNQQIEDLDDEDLDDTRDDDEDAPEFESVEAFVEYLLEEDRSSFTSAELQKLATRLGRRPREVRKELEGYGLVPLLHGAENRVRTFRDNPHDRWYGPGSSPTHGGSGWEQIAGQAGREG
jgi:hypothetical protein